MAITITSPPPPELKHLLGPQVLPHVWGPVYSFVGYLCILKGFLE